MVKIIFTNGFISTNNLNKTNGKNTVSENYFGSSQEVLFWVACSQPIFPDVPKDMWSAILSLTTNYIVMSLDIFQIYE